MDISTKKTVTTVRVATALLYKDHIKRSKTSSGCQDRRGIFMTRPTISQPNAHDHTRSFSLAIRHSSRRFPTRVGFMDKNGLVGFDVTE
jgi:hypothetical protein